MADISRRQFLRGDFSGRQAVRRPPWALRERDFQLACTRCGDCIEACPQQILASDKAGWPTVDFSRGECTFCGKCVEACRPRALEKAEGKPPWQLKARIQDNCLARANVVCRACGDACPAQAIRFSPHVMSAARPEISNELCTGCGACQAPCPAQAILVA